MEPISLKERVSYGFGDLACNLMFQMVSAYLMFFYTDVAGIGLGAVSVIMLASRIVDAVTDPMMGMVVDKTKTKWGKARPYILWMAVPFAVISIAMFVVPDLGSTGKFIYALITYILFCVVYTALNIPYTTMMSSMTDDESARLSFNMFKSLGASTGGFIVMGATLALVGLFGGGDQKRGFLLTIALYSVVGMILLLICFKNTKERIVVEEEKGSVLGSLKTAVKNKYWCLLCFISFFLFSGMILKNQSTLYFAKYYLKQEGVAAMLMTIPTIISFGIAFLIPVIARRIGRRNCVLLGGIFAMAGAVVISAAGTRMPVIIAGTLISSVGIGLALGVVFVMCAETVDYSEWQTGTRPQGIMVAVVGFMVKLGMALAGAIGAQILKFGGYVENAAQSEKAVSAIRMNFIWVPAMFFGAVVVMAVFYDLDKKYGKVMEEIRERRAS